MIYDYASLRLFSPVSVTETRNDGIVFNPEELDKLHTIYFDLDPNIRKICFQYVGIIETISEIFRRERNNLQCPSLELQKTLDIIASFRDIVHEVNLSNADFNEIIEPKNGKPYANSAMRTFAQISKCLPNITHMHLSNSNVGDYYSVGALVVQFRKLQYLNLDNNTFFHSAPIPELLTLPYLKTLTFVQCTQFQSDFSTATPSLDVSKLKKQVPHIEIISEKI